LTCTYPYYAVYAPVPFILQVLYNWYDAATAPGNGDVAWHYYSEHALAGKVINQIEAIATTKHAAAYDTIIILGYSYGGDAALALATRLNADQIAVDLALTCDPVQKGVIPGLVYPYSQKGAAMGTPCPKNVADWENFYQQVDTRSLSALGILNYVNVQNTPLPPLQIYGRTVTGADSNQDISAQITNRATAHIEMPTLATVVDTIRRKIRNLPGSKAAYWPP